MKYTNEQKREAFKVGQLWWRFPGGAGEYARQWSKIDEDLVGVEPSDFSDPDAEYHIGDKPPRVLSELERELLAVAEHCERMLMTYSINTVNGESIEDEALDLIRAAIAKAKGEA